MDIPHEDFDRFQQFIRDDANFASFLEKKDSFVVIKPPNFGNFHKIRTGDELLTVNGEVWIFHDDEFLGYDSLVLGGRE